MRAALFLQPIPAMLRCPALRASAPRAGALAGALLLLGSGCSDHFSTQEAYEICDTLTERNPGTNPPEAFLDCVACYETCGEDCEATGETPQQYVCPDEVVAEGEGGAE